MESEIRHRVLIVDDEAKVATAISRVLKMEQIDTVTVDSGEEGLEIMKTTVRPFSLIIADQRMPGIKGTQFFEEAKTLSPDTVRFLITGYSQMETILQAVNRGAVQKYITKPWDHDELIASVQSGLRLYERFQENEKLLLLAKKQNKQLYDLSCELMELTTDHNKKLKILDREIEALKKISPRQTEDERKEDVLDRLAGEIEKALAEELDQDHLDRLFYDTVEALFQDFNDLAQRNGFEMPDPAPEDTQESDKGLIPNDSTNATSPSQGLNRDE